jgi:Protein of unknown function (DUF1189).
MNIFKEMALAIYDYKSYQGFLNNKKGKVFGFGVVLMLIYWVITMGIPCVRLFAGSGGLVNQVDEVVPDFELADGVLWVDDVVEYEESGIYVNIDTDPDSYFYDASQLGDLLYDYSQVILMDSEKVIMKNNGQVQQYYFDELEGLEFSKADLLGFLPFVYLWIAIFLILAYFWITALFFFGVLFVALLGMVVASCMKYQLTFGQLYLLGIYSRVLPLIIKAAVSFLPFNIPFFWVINFGISLLILGCAIQKMKEQRVQEPLEFSSASGADGAYNGNGYGGDGGNFTGNYGAEHNNYSNYGGDTYQNSNGTGNISSDNSSDKNGKDGNDFSWMK